MGTPPKKPGSNVPLAPVSALRRSASLSQGSSATVTPSQAPTLTLATRPEQNSKLVSAAPSSGSWLSFFFDGTGNNLDADFPKNSKLDEREHSNVARLYRAHPPDDPKRGLYRFYIPGIGTYFKDVNDKGNTKLGRGFGEGGEERLEWAMKTFDRTLEKTTGPVNVALFGFSRGAALARAFARRLAKRCTNKQGVWHLNMSTRPIHLYFMGLFDTVASVGMAAQNEASPDALISVRLALLERNGGEASLHALAPGAKPGADPTPSMTDGHMSWGSNLRLPPMVKRCVHMVAAHEIRNSFPLDSLLNETSYPSHCEEIVYPGVHSDVGGGYRPGEGARGMEPGAQLSLIPLRQMHSKAVQYGVPLLKDFKIPELQEDFGYDGPRTN